MYPILAYNAAVIRRADARRFQLTHLPYVTYFLYVQGIELRSIGTHMYRKYRKNGTCMYRKYRKVCYYYVIDDFLFN